MNDIEFTEGVAAQLALRMAIARARKSQSATERRMQELTDELRANPKTVCQFDGIRQELAPILFELFVDQITKADVVAWMTADEVEVGRMVARDLRNVLWGIVEREAA